jgi:phage terminase large subunit GpA-like protein
MNLTLLVIYVFDLKKIETRSWTKKWHESAPKEFPTASASEKIYKNSLVGYVTCVGREFTASAGPRE